MQVACNCLQELFTGPSISCAFWSTLVGTPRWDLHDLLLSALNTTYFFNLCRQVHGLWEVGRNGSPPLLCLMVALQFLHGPFTVIAPPPQLLHNAGHCHGIYPLPTMHLFDIWMHHLCIVSSTSIPSCTTGAGRKWGSCSKRMCGKGLEHDASYMQAMASR